MSFNLKIAAVFAIGALPFVMPMSASASSILFLQGQDNTLDSSDNGNNATWVGTAAYATGAVGDAFSLNGRSYLSVASSPSLNLGSSGSVTISAYVNPTSASLSSERIVDKLTAGTNNGYLLDILGDHFRLIVGATALTSKATVSANVFTAVAGVYDATAHTESLYVNGVLDSTVADAGFIDNNFTVLVGSDHNGENRFNGLIDQVLISNTATLPQAVPEPATWSVMGLGLAAMAGVIRRRKRVAG